MKHSHSTHEEARQCALRFGECWERPVTKNPDRKDWSNYPKGETGQNKWLRFD